MYCALKSFSLDLKKIRHYFLEWKKKNKAPERALIFASKYFEPPPSSYFLFVSNSIKSNQASPPPSQIPQIPNFSLAFLLSFSLPVAHRGSCYFVISVKTLTFRVLVSSVLSPWRVKP
jgi:hypothetical protein